MRSLFVVLHRWLALGASVFLILVTLSGAALVYSGDVERSLDPSLWRVERGTATLPLDTLVARAETAGGHMVALLALPEESDGVLVANSGPMQVMLDPYTGRVTGVRTPEQRDATLSQRLERLHTSLFANSKGRTVVALVTVATVVLLLTGLILWWHDRIWRLRMLRSWKRMNFDLHHALGLYASLLLLILSGTGVLIHYGRVTRWISRQLSGGPPVAMAKQPRADSGAHRISWDRAVAVARGALPGASVTTVNYPPWPQQPIVISLRFPDESVARSHVVIDRFSGRPLQVENSRDAQTGTRFGGLVNSLHTTNGLSDPLRLLWFVGAMLLAIQAVTGLIMWWNSRAARRSV